MLVIKNKVRIHQSAKQVWSALTDLSKYPAWNPFMVLAQGEMKVNKGVKFLLQIDTDKLKPSSVTITHKISPYLLIWESKTLFPYWQKHQCYMKIELINEQEIEFIQFFYMKGLKTWFLGKNILRFWEKGLQDMAKALKEHLEKTNQEMMASKDALKHVPPVPMNQFRSLQEESYIFASRT